MHLARSCLPRSARSPMSWRAQAEFALEPLRAEGRHRRSEYRSAAPLRRWMTSAGILDHADRATHDGASAG